MADFNNLALSYVLSDKPDQQQKLAASAAEAIQSEPRPSKAIVQWIQSVQPWIAAEEGGANNMSTGDAVERSKALSFLADTLGVIKNDVLKGDQVTLLISFFSSMFQVDQRHGVLPAVRALGHVAQMPAFKATQADQIIQSIGGLKDDFKSQLPQTRIQIYQLIVQLVGDAGVASDLQYRHGASAGFMTDLMQMCRNERDPSCLMVWFDILRLFLQEYSPSPEVSEEIFNVFSAYFPISLRSSTTPSGITADDLKKALRDCFAANYRVAHLTVPYLVERLDQGDAITASVKLDILQTLRACIQRYSDVNQGVAPFADKIWTSLKYEVRNGEVEDAVKETALLIRSLFSRLEGRDLQGLVLTAQRDCLDDLDNPTYVAAMQKLLVAVSSASPEAFAPISLSTLNHVKNGLRRTKSSEHTRSLFGLLNALQHVRVFQMQPTSVLSEDAVASLKHTEGPFSSLYQDVFAQPLREAFKPGASNEAMSIGKEAAEGVALMFTQQRSVGSRRPDDSILSPDDVSTIFSEFTTFLLSKSDSDDDSESEQSWALVQSSMRVLQAAVTAIPNLFQDLARDAFTSIQKAFDTSHEQLIQRLQFTLRKLAFIGCSELPLAEDKLQHLILLLGMTLDHMWQILDRKAPVSVWIEFANGINATLRSYWDACSKSGPPEDEDVTMAGSEIARKPRESPRSVGNTAASTPDFGNDERFQADKWIAYIAHRFPSLSTAQQDVEAKLAESNDQQLVSSDSHRQLLGDAMLIFLFVTRRLFRRATRVVVSQGENAPCIELSRDFNGSDVAQDKQRRIEENHYLNLVSTIALFSISRLGSGEQEQLRLLDEVPALFRGGDSLDDPALGSQAGVKLLRDVLVSEVTPEFDSTWTGPSTFPVVIGNHSLLAVLSYGVSRPLRLTTGLSNEASVKILTGILVSSLLPKTGPAHQSAVPFSGVMVRDLASKIPIEKMPGILGLMQKQIEATPLPVLYITAGSLRRYRGSYLRPLISSIVQAPAHPDLGYRFATVIGSALYHDDQVGGDSDFSHPNPIWRQRAYVEIMKPMLGRALPLRNEQTDMGVGIDYSVGVLCGLVNLDPEIYNDDLEDIIRMVIYLVRTLPVSKDVYNAFSVLRTICSREPGRVEPFLGSIVDICTSVLVSTESDESQLQGEKLRGHQLYRQRNPDRRYSAGHVQRYALLVLQELPAKHEARQLRQSATNVVRTLWRMLGDRHRETRATAQVAMTAWTPLTR